MSDTTVAGPRAPSADERGPGTIGGRRTRGCRTMARVRRRRIEGCRRRPRARGHPTAAHRPPGRGGRPAGAGHRDEVEEVGYAGLTVRNVARRAGVAPATAYNYFSSKDHLLAEVLWRRMQALPPVDADRGRPVHDRVADAVRAMVLFATESPALVDACTLALLSTNPDVKHLRDRIGEPDPPPAGRRPRARRRPHGGPGAADLLLGRAARQPAWATSPRWTSPSSWPPRPP